MVSVCTVPARGGRLCERFGGYKTINQIPLVQDPPENEKGLPYLFYSYTYILIPIRNLAK